MDTNEVTDWVPDTSSLGARLALVRWRMGWNVREAERECGVSQNTWSGWEQGKTPRNVVEVVTKIAWRTKVKRDWLLFGAGSPSAPDDEPTDEELPHLDSNQEPAGFKPSIAGELINVNFGARRAI